MSADDLAADKETRGGPAGSGDAAEEETDQTDSLDTVDSGEPEFSGEAPGFGDWREELRERLKRIRARREQERQENGGAEDAEAPGLSAEMDAGTEDELDLAEEADAGSADEPELPDETNAGTEDELDLAEKADAGSADEPELPEETDAGSEEELDLPDEAEAGTADEPELAEPEEPIDETTESDEDVEDAADGDAPMGEIVDLSEILRDTAEEETAADAVGDLELAGESDGESDVSTESLGREGHEVIPPDPDDVLEPLAELEEAVDKAESALTSEPLGPDAVLELVGGAEAADAETADELGEPAAGESEGTEANEPEIPEATEPEEPGETETVEVAEPGDPEEAPAKSDEPFDLLDLDEIEQRVPEIELDLDRATGDDDDEWEIDPPPPVMPPLPEEGDTPAPELDFEPPPFAETPTVPEIDVALEAADDQDVAWDADEEPLVVPTPGPDRSAGPLGERAAAALCDALVLLALGATLLTVASSATGRTMAQILTNSGVWLGLAWALFAVGYSIFFVGTCGQTVGRMVMKLRVIRSDQFTVGFDRATIRLGAFLVSVLPLGAGLLPALRDPQRRTLHDRLSKTRVVKA